MQQNCQQEQEEKEDTFKSKEEEEEETELFHKKLDFVKGNQNKNKVLNTFVKKKSKLQTATHVLYAKTTSIVLPKYRSPAPSLARGLEAEDWAHALEFVRSAAKRSSDSRASAPLRGRSLRTCISAQPKRFAQLSATY